MIFYSKQNIAIVLPDNNGSAIAILLFRHRLKVEGALPNFFLKHWLKYLRIVKANLALLFGIYCIAFPTIGCMLSSCGHYKINSLGDNRSMLSLFDRGMDLDIWISACRSGMDKSGLSICFSIAASICLRNACSDGARHNSLILRLVLHLAAGNAFVLITIG